MTNATRVVLYDATTGERLIAADPSTDPKVLKGWVLRWRTSYGRRTGHKIRVEHEPVAPAPAVDAPAYDSCAGDRVQVGGTA